MQRNQKFENLVLAGVPGERKSARLRHPITPDTVRRQQPAGVNKLAATDNGDLKVSL